MLANSCILNNEKLVAKINHVHKFHMLILIQQQNLKYKVIIFQNTFLVSNKIKD